MNKVLCIGEILIDMIAVGSDDLATADQFQKKAGGAPANVAVGIKRLGGNAYFLGKLGYDAFGRFLTEVLTQDKVNIDYCTYGEKTTLALVIIDKNGEREFTFFRGNDEHYILPATIYENIKQQDILHFGSATALLGGALERSYFNLLEFGIKNNNYISFDPNYRSDLIAANDLADYVEKCKQFIKHSDIVKLSKDELFILANQDNIELAIDYIHSIGAKNVFITLGDQGSFISINGTKKIIETIAIQQLDATGAGDAFIAGVLTKVAEKEDKKITFVEWAEITKFANKVGALTCMKYGGIPALPTLNELN